MRKIRKKQIAVRHREKIANSVSEFVDCSDLEKRNAERKGNKADLLFRGQPSEFNLLPRYENDLICSE